MSTRSTIIALISLGLASMATAHADGLAIRGTVKGTDGKLLAGAEVRAERLDHKGSAVVTKTDGKGEYNFKGLDLGAYKVTTIVNKVPKSAANVRTRATGWVRVDFDLKALAANKAGTHKRQIWVSGETGSHIGGGHWETVDEPNTGTGASAMERVDGAALRTSNELNPAGGASGPSH
jgi:carboxypeptidase family protein